MVQKMQNLMSNVGQKYKIVHFEANNAFDVL